MISSQLLKNTITTLVFSCTLIHTLDDLEIDIFSKINVCDFITQRAQLPHEQIMQGIQCILALGNNLNALTREGENALHLVARDESLAWLIPVLINLGVNQNAQRCIDLVTPLMCAVDARLETNVASLLADPHIDLSLEDATYGIASDRIEEGTEIYKLLIQAEEKKLGQRLLTGGRIIFWCNNILKNHEFPLHAFFGERQRAELSKEQITLAARYLLRKGTNPHALESEGGNWDRGSILTIIADRYYTAHLAPFFLCRLGVNPNARATEKSYTPLMLAADRADIKLVQLLCNDPRVDLHLKGGNTTALQIAQEHITDGGRDLLAQGISGKHILPFIPVEDYKEVARILEDTAALRSVKDATLTQKEQ